MTRENPRIPWCSNCGSMMLILGEEGRVWFECYKCKNPDNISYEEDQKRVKKQKEEWKNEKKETV